MSISLGQINQRKKIELLEIVENLAIEPIYVTYFIAENYEHTIIKALSYHCELQLIEKVWGMAKNKIAFNDKEKGTAATLMKKLEESPSGIQESYLLSI